LHSLLLLGLKVALPRWCSTEQGSSVA